ncbi:MAG: histidinol-phosphatase HisJ family protein [Oscillospiraceae bacterium]|nr:histidinol-phosphatase HisJ family protein [Oscillospiraceae bacterium]
MIMNLHTHTHHSPDAHQTVAERVEAANRLGLRFMAVTDHVEINRYYPAEYYHAEPSDMYFYNGKGVFEDSMASVAAAQADCAPLVLLAGAEVGQIPQDPEKSALIYQDPRVDLVIGSVHELPGRPDFYFLNYDEEDIPALVTAYFEEVLRTAQSDCYDILGHLTYGLRYLPDRRAYDLTPHLELIDEILMTVIRKQKAIELNGSGLRKPQLYIDPDLVLVKRYRELGGRYLTISTDAHDTQYLGFGIDLLEDMARTAGFSELTVFRKHEPFTVSL